MVSSMEEEFTLLQMARGKRASGRKAKELDGLTKTPAKIRVQASNSNISNNMG